MGGLGVRDACPLHNEERQAEVRMQILQKALDEVLATVSQRILADILTPKLKSQGLLLSKREERNLINHILKRQEAPLELRSWRFWGVSAFLCKRRSG